MKSLLRRLGFALLVPLSLGTIFLARRRAKTRIGGWIKYCVMTLGLLVGFATAGVFGLRIYISHEGNSELQGELAYLHDNDPRWEIDQILADLPPIKEEENGIQLVMRLHDELKEIDRRERALSSDPFDPEIHQLPSENWNIASDPNVVEKRKKYFESRSAICELARGMKKYPASRYPLVLPEEQLSFDLTHTMASRSIVGLLNLESTSLLDTGISHNRIPDNIRAMINISRCMRDDPMIVGVLVRVAERHLALRSLGAYMARVANPLELQSIQKVLIQEEEEDIFTLAIRGERALEDRTIRKIWSKEIPMKMMFSASLDIPSPIPDGFEMFLLQPYLGYNRANSFRIYRETIAISTSALEFQMKGVSEIGRGFSNSFPECFKSLTARLCLPPVQKIYEAAMRDRAQMRCMIVLVATERFRQANGRWPNSSDELSPAYLKAVPNDPFTGRPLIWKKMDDGICVYSVGKNGKDDGGDIYPKPDDGPPVPSKSTRPPNDVGYRLWDVNRRNVPFKQP